MKKKRTCVIYTDTSVISTSIGCVLSQHDRLKGMILKKSSHTHTYIRTVSQMNTQLAAEISEAGINLRSPVAGVLLQQGLLIIRRLLLMLMLRLLMVLMLRSLVEGRSHGIGPGRHGGVMIGRHVHGHACLRRVQSSSGLVHVLSVHTAAVEIHGDLTQNYIKIFPPPKIFLNLMSKTKLTNYNKRYFWK